MKNTYIFKLSDAHMDEHRLEKLVIHLRDTIAVSWKYEQVGDKYTSVQVFTHEATLYHILHRAGITSAVHTLAIKQARLNGDSATGRAQQKLDDAKENLRRVQNNIKTGRGKALPAETVNRYVFREGEEGVTYAQINKMRESLGVYPPSQKVDVWDVAASPTEMIDAARAANVSGAAVVAARKRAVQSRFDAARRCPEIKSYGPTEHAEKAAEVSILLSLTVAMTHLLNAGCDLMIERLTTGDYQVRVFDESFTFGNADGVAGFLSGLEKGFVSSPQWAARLPGATKRSKRSA